MSEADKIIKNLKNSGKKVEEFYVSNKTSDINVGSIDEKAVNDDIELIKNLIENNKIEIKNVSVGQEFRLLRTLQNILAEREQKDKRIKELEADLYSANEIISDLIDNIPKQAVIDKIEELNKEIKSCDEIDAIFKIKQQQILQELLEGERK